MTQTDYLSLGRRLLAAGCPWRERMLWIEPPSGDPDDEGDRGMVGRVDEDGIPYDSESLAVIPTRAVPDLSDPLTVAAAWLELEERIGCPLDLVSLPPSRTYPLWRAWLEDADSEVGVGGTPHEARAEAVALAWIFPCPCSALFAWESLHA